MHTSEPVAPYAGVAFEYEFDGKAKGRVHGMRMSATSMKGGTTIGKVGLAFLPPDNPNLHLNFGVEAHPGKRDGVSGMFRLVYTF